MIELKSLSVGYKTSSGMVPALDNVTMSLDRGEICALIGPSGCGKSTLLYVLSGIISDYTGSALIDGIPAAPGSRRVGLIPQNYGLLDWADVYSNAMLGVDIKDGKAQSRSPSGQAYADYILEKLGLSELKRKFPGSLSGGQRQRVAIARSFILKPDILLMDEPFSALDAITREEIQDLFLDIWKENRVSTLFVTHSIEEAVYTGRKIAVMSPSPGRITKILENPLFGTDGLRMKNCYYEYCMDIRAMVKEEWAKC